ncbi:zinc finger HIT domain-containing protein 2-like isoform X1 [Littorina saxatilis]|uniref:HIT-type domain-containing protein n=1 Tax=Littorina saxatilis TaxID=31220 RepID=A0AAN9G3N1_9CAEN
MAASIKIVKSSDDEEDGPAIENKHDICSVCVEKESRYTCPRCNIRYCSLPCYKHKKHEGCSESFYKDWVMDEMKEHTASPEEKQKVLEMLAREHEQQEEDLDDADDDNPSLAERMEDLDLDKDAAEVWKRLTAQEKEEFAQMMKDGRLANLVSIWTPWWMAKSASSLVQEASGNGLPEGFPPHLTDVPDINQLLKSKPSADVKHNVVNVISAYAFVTRLHNGDHLEYAVECSEELLQVCGVLKHGENYPGPKEAVHAVIQQVHKEGSGFVVPSSFPVVVMGDVIRILRGHRLSPFGAVLSALSDTVALLKAASKELKKGGKRRRKRKPKPTEDGDQPEADFDKQLFLAKRKLTFLLSWTERYGMCLAQLCDELSLELECLKSEAAETRSLQTTVEQALKSGKLHTQGAKVEEVTQDAELPSSAVQSEN